MVEKRKRMLQKFLNRLAKHEILSYEHVFHRFLETGVSWVSSCPSTAWEPSTDLLELCAPLLEQAVGCLTSFHVDMANDIVPNSDSPS